MNMRYLEGRVEGLLLEVERSKQECQQLQEAHAGKKQALERENDLLREQLKKYVSMVQTQWKDTPNRQSNTGMSRACVCMHACVCACVRTCMCVYMCVCAYMCLYMCCMCVNVVCACTRV